MDTMKKFLETIYLGDRYCERFEIKDNRIIFQINLISRLEEGTTEWNYYSGKDIEHGFLVFDEVVDYTLNSELTFNDEISEIEVIGKKDKVYSFVVYGCNISDEAVSTDIELRVRAKNFYIFNPQNNSIIKATELYNTVIKFKVLDKISVNGLEVVSVEGDTSFIQNGLKLKDEKGNAYEIQTVAMVHYKKTKDIRHYAELVLNGDVKNIGQYLYLEIDNNLEV